MRSPMLHKVLEHSPDPIAVTDRAYRFVYLNPAYDAEFERIYGTRPTVGADFRDTIPYPPDLDSAVALHDRVILGETLKVEGEFGHPQFRRGMYHFSLSPYVDENGDIAGCLQVIHPIAEAAGEARKLRRALHDSNSRYRQAETRLRRWAEEAVAARAEAERAAIAKSQFLAAASHDLRQPVQSLVLFSELLRQRLTDPISRDIFEHLNLALDALRGILDSLLEVARLDADLVRPVRQPVALASLLAERRAPRLRVVPCSLTVDSDPDLLGLMLQKLIDNALRFSSGDILVGCRRQGHSVRLEVLDRGIGLTEEQTEIVFEDFVQLGNPERDRIKGLGLGLGIVRRLSRLLDHPVLIASEPGRGSRFSIILPLWRSGQEKGEVRGACAHPLNLA